MDTDQDRRALHIGNRHEIGTRGLTQVGCLDGGAGFVFEGNSDLVNPTIPITSTRSTGTKTEVINGAAKRASSGKARHPFFAVSIDIHGSAVPILLKGPVNPLASVLDIIFFNAVITTYAGIPVDATVAPWVVDVKVPSEV